MTSRHQQYRAALDVAAILLPMLNPAPGRISITCHPWSPEEVEIDVCAHQDVEAVRLWHAAVGGDLITEPHGAGRVCWTVRAELAGIPLELWTLVDAPAETDTPDAGHGDPEAEPSTVYRSELGPITLGTYGTLQAAQDHCTSHYRDTSGDGPLSWRPETSEDDSALRMYADDQGDGVTDLETVYRIVPVPVQAAYDPEADG